MNSLEGVDWFGLISWALIIFLFRYCCKAYLERASGLLRCLSLLMLLYPVILFLNTEVDPFFYSFFRNTLNVFGLFVLSIGLKYRLCSILGKIGSELFLLFPGFLRITMLATLSPYSSLWLSYPLSRSWLFCDELNKIDSFIMWLGSAASLLYWACMVLKRVCGLVRDFARVFGAFEGRIRW